MYNFLVSVNGNGAVIITEKPGAKQRYKNQVLDHIVQKIKEGDFKFQENKHEEEYEKIDIFFKWLDKKFPSINRITSSEKNELLKDFLSETQILVRALEFTKNIPEHVISKKISVRGRTCHGYEIKNKNPKNEYFQTEYKSSSKI